jgi:hypothetical protein
VETIDAADRPLVAPPFLPTSLATDSPRCRRCAAVLVVAHLRCDDGVLVPVYRCPICRHAPVDRPRSSFAGLGRPSKG